MTSQYIWSAAGLIWIAGSVYQYKANNLVFAAIYLVVGLLNISVAFNF